MEYLMTREQSLAELSAFAANPHFEPDSDIYGTALYDALVEAQQAAQEAQQ